MRNTRGSRRISSAIASRTASPYVSSRSLMTAPPWLQPAQRFGLEPSEILQVLTKDPDDQVRVDPRVLVDDDVPESGHLDHHMAEVRRHQARLHKNLERLRVRRRSAQTPRSEEHT